MDYTQSFAISAAGMALERTRVDVAALNMANANTIRTPDGAVYRPLHVVARPGNDMLRTLSTNSFETLVEQGDTALLGALPSASIEEMETAPRMVYEPGHPMADQRGFVAYAGVDPAHEMMTLMNATRSYEANVAAMNTARTLALKALEIGGA